MDRTINIFYLRDDIMKLTNFSELVFTIPLLWMLLILVVVDTMAKKVIYYTYIQVK